MVTAMVQVKGVTLAIQPMTESGVQCIGVSELVEGGRRASRST